MPIKSDDGIWLVRTCPTCQGSGQQPRYNGAHRTIEVPEPRVCKECAGKGFHQVCTTVAALMRYIASHLSSV